jgi:probable F420-dependent oxidoreductase
VRVGIATPVVVQTPGSSGAAWIGDAGIEEIAAIAVRADELGYHHLTCSEHVAVPTSAEAQRGAVYWDPLATFGFVAARTTQIRLVTNVLVLGYHHPLAIAKRYGTLDRVSGGRLVLGLGVGSLEEEFALLGVPFADRGERADDALAALRAAMSQRVPEYHGTHYDFAGMVVDPHALQARVPFWIGGRTRRSLRRAVAAADGWTPFGLAPEQLAGMLASVDLPDGFDVVLGPPAPLDPLADPDGARRALDDLAALGTTVVNLTVRHDSLAHHLEQLEAFVALGGLSPRR